MEIARKALWKPDRYIQSSWLSATIILSINHSLRQSHFICALLTKCWVVLLETRAKTSEEDWAKKGAVNMYFSII